MAVSGNIQVDWKEAPDFKRIYATNVFTAVVDYDFHMIFGVCNLALQAQPMMIPKANGQYLAEVILPLRSLKELKTIVDEALKQAELKFGEIKIPKSPEDYFQR